jgi:diguanylate cyclase (GGDEF)-like protein
MRALARQSLEVAGFTVREARDGHEALAALNAPDFDLVLLDVDMPGPDGFRVCEAIRAAPALRDLPVLMMTGLGDLESVQRAYEAGATDFVIKPPNWVILAHRVRHMVRASRVTAELRRSEEKLAHAQRIANLGWWEWEAGSNRFSGSDDFYRILGLERAAFGETWETFLRCVCAEDRGRVQSAFEEALRDAASLNLDYRVLRGDGAIRVVHQQGQVQRSESGAEVLLTGTLQDVTERREIEQQVRHLAYFDGLTGLPNRRLFQERLHPALEAARRHRRTAALLFLDLDRFKRINDTMGHSAGDALLREAADRISASLRLTDCVGRPGEPGSDSFVARLGGDEFIVLLSEIERVQDAGRVARRLIDALSHPFVVAGQEVFISASLGIAIYPFDGEDPETLLKNADTAMYHAKDQGRNNFQYYTESMNASAFERLVLESSLRKALERGEFVLHYQPQVCLTSGAVVGAEALVRWNHPELGLVPPSGFIGLAEETGLIVPLGLWVLRAACVQGKAWQDEGHRHLRVAVNVSGRQFAQPGFVREVAAILAETGITPALLDLELTETVLMEDAEENLAVLQELKALGVRLSIDDFGTGYSSLGYLRRLPIGALKVDRSFLAGVPSDEDRTTITSAIVALGRSLRLGVIAEGVESPEQVAFLRELGCDEMQGYLVSRPLPPRDFAALLEPGYRWGNRGRAPAPSPTGANPG